MERGSSHLSAPFLATGSSMVCNPSSASTEDCQNYFCLSQLDSVPAAAIYCSYHHGAGLYVVIDYLSLAEDWSCFFSRCELEPECGNYCRLGVSVAQRSRRNCFCVWCVLEAEKMSCGRSWSSCGGETQVLGKANWRGGLAQIHWGEVANWSIYHHCGDIGVVGKRIGMRVVWQLAPFGEEELRNEMRSGSSFASGCRHRLESGGASLT